MSSTVQDLERKVQSLKDQLREAEESLQLAREDEFPVKIGSRVKFRDFRGKSHIGEVHRISFSSWSRSKPTLDVHPITKTGVPSKSSKYVYDYEVEK